MEFLVAQHGADHVRGAGGLPAAGLPRRLRARRQRHLLRAGRHRAGPAAAAFFQALPERVWGVMSNDTLLAVPFFTFMGLILERSGMAEDLLDTIGQVFGPLRGGLAFAVILVGALLAATTGVVAASVISMGLISLPIMLRYGYDRRFASGVIAASGTLAQIIPPSLVLIIMADQLGRSVGDMYAGAIIPGLVLTGLYALYAVGVTIVKPAWAPALPVEARRLGEADGSGGTTSLAVLIAISSAVAVAVRPAGHPRAIPRGTAGRAPGARRRRGGGLRVPARRREPPARARFPVAPGAAGGLRADSAARAHLPRPRHDLPRLGHPDRRRRHGRGGRARDGRRAAPAFVRAPAPGDGQDRQALHLRGLHPRSAHGSSASPSTASTATSGSRSSSRTCPGGALGFLIVVNILIFVLAFFLDFFELSFIVVPLLAPVAEKLGIDLIWFGVLLGVNMQTSFMHPPFGFALFYLRSVAPAKAFLDKATGKPTAPVTTGQIYWGAVPFVRDPGGHGGAGDPLSRRWSWSTRTTGPGSTPRRCSSRSPRRNRARRPATS